MQACIASLPITWEAVVSLCMFGQKMISCVPFHLTGEAIRLQVTRYYLQLMARRVVAALIWPYHPTAQIVEQVFSGQLMPILVMREILLVPAFYVLLTPMTLPKSFGTVTR